MNALVKDCMSRHEVTVTPTSTIMQVATLMKQHDIGFLPVLDQQTCVGVITDRDIVIRGIADGVDVQQSIERLYTRDVIQCTPSTSVHDAAKQMAEHRIRRLLVMDGGQLLGIVALADLATNEESKRAAGKALSGISQD